MVGQEGLEPSTPSLSGTYSNHLSYCPTEHFQLSNWNCHIHCINLNYNLTTILFFKEQES